MYRHLEINMQIHNCTSGLNGVALTLRLDAIQKSSKNDLAEAMIEEIKWLCDGILNTSILTDRHCSINKIS